jgi:putative ABC transport system permease protein
MTWRYAFLEALAAIRFHRRRTAVTVISLAWGVTCFLVLMSYGDGFSATLTKAFTAIGQDLIITMSGQTSEQAGGLRAGRRIRIRYSDAQTLKDSVPSIAFLSPEHMQGGVRIAKGTRETDGSIRAVWPEYGIIRNQILVAGRWISEADQHQQQRVVVLGSEIAREVFKGLPAIGEDIRLNGIRFTVIGVLQSKLQIANYNRRDNECVFIPYSAFRLFGDAEYPMFLIWKAVSPQYQDQAMTAARAKLAELHRFSPTDEKAIEMLAFSQFMHIITGMSLAVQALLGLVGTLTLGIGGVGLANIMLASVIDRTREIGMLKALGARRPTILRQFLLEAALIVGVGGLLGLILGTAVVAVIGSMPLLGPIQEHTGDQGNIQLQLSLPAVLVSMGVLFAVGLVAGMAPAIKAARLDPIEALHYE